MKREEHLKGYKFLRATVGKLFKIYYKPKILNKDVIPKDGPILICSNHIHLFDQNIACISTNRMIHYMSKKEHLEGKFGWFFKMAGCIKVDRSIHDEEAKQHAINILKNGYALGIFPEGTRNQVFGKKEENIKLYERYKEEYSYDEFINILKNNQVCISELNLLYKLIDEKRITSKDFHDNALNILPYMEELLKQHIITEEEFDSHLFLPLKFGAVSMAQKTSATIVPVIVTGKYIKKDNHLNARFGKPFKVTDELNLEEANNILFKEMVRLKKEGLKDIKEGKI